MIRLETMVATVALALTVLTCQSMKAQERVVRNIIDPVSETLGDWYQVNDGVMGGRSSSAMRRSSDGTAVFEGDLSLENNGGFASVRTVLPEAALSGSSRLLLRVRGDGKRYQVRLRMSTGFDGIAYGAGFDTVADEWITVEIPLRSFEPSFRGRRPRGAPPLDPTNVRQLGVMLTDKQEGRFRLEIDWVGVDGD